MDTIRSGSHRKVMNEPSGVSFAYGTKKKVNRQEGKEKRLTKAVDTCVDICCSTETERMRVGWKLRVEVANDEPVLGNIVLGQTQPKHYISRNGIYGVMGEQGLVAFFYSITLG